MTNQQFRILILELEAIRKEIRAGTELNAAWVHAATRYPDEFATRDQIGDMTDRAVGARETADEFARLVEESVLKEAEIVDLLRPRDPDNLG